MSFRNNLQIISKIGHIGDEILYKYVLKHDGKRRSLKQRVRKYLT